MGGFKSLKTLHNLPKTTTFITTSWKNLRVLLVVICVCDKMGRGKRTSCLSITEDAVGTTLYINEFR